MTDVLEELSGIIAQRLREMPEGSYTASLAKKGKGYVARKVGEEAVEVVVASLSEGRERVVSETADLIYHLLVLLAMEGISLDEVRDELRRRMK
ncbi:MULTISPECIES: phosphoribosyl-ATP diphosphatase [Metallosphaera]|uniref:Phosphoribosyl-ATP pyrophosphatase n=3 Tax=Metallosphaera TaxID=41980 RepID=HIS2_METS5|nr:MULTISPECIES: phosphoribosyl-ATP diphosphatase [Metallosphaera]A4YI36.1 RecName: Full=Phosphoribosyl-ATP pyrophosphatase; Short=PRA-PH [Metallosphaera sedula DSM 5348]ABP96088.1 phosphoribosyl-ATP pyrophosphatase [Metallosphaera sedula DSM 5348]AIM28072.1 phosphoribosyl-ATP pyrophosphatase [Metallosphaera sedula]AKV74900.1 phosphoribosyl-ATP pyrophosphatase [Metallosphaera sedula]AKV77138.1 phosphoribosyl-ATP pyrophosphatase [Metallosphaera sedula]AKV79388.1 phosphoribosyl-ATP pyrophosphat